MRRNSEVGSIGSALLGVRIDLAYILLHGTKKCLERRENNLNTDRDAASNVRYPSMIFSLSRTLSHPVVAVSITALDRKLASTECAMSEHSHAPDHGPLNMDQCSLELSFLASV